MIKIWHHKLSNALQSDYFSLNGYSIGEPMDPVVVDRPDGTDDYLFMYFADPVEVAVRGQDIPVPPGTLMVWQPGSTQRYGNRTQGYLHSWLHCNGALVRHMILTCGIPLDTPVADLHRNRFELHIHGMHSECSSGHAPDPRIVENHLRNLAYEIQRAAQGGEGQRRVPGGLLKARQYIESHYWERITLAQLADIAGVSPPHFSTQFRKAFGEPPITYLLKHRLAQAAYLLLNRNTRVGDVAAQVGIEDIHYFSRAFKRQYGRSPRGMRTSR